MGRRLRKSWPVLLAASLAAALTGGTGVLWREAHTEPAARSATGLSNPAMPAGAVPDGTLSAPDAAAAVATLVVAAAGSLDGYDRDCGRGHGCVFGPAWADADRNGCDQRNDVLRRDLTEITIKPDTHGCVITSGQLLDPYTGHTIDWSKTDATAVHVDHVVSLAGAWTAGADRWPLERRQTFAGDLRNLLAVDGPTNSGKGDDTAGEWTPPNPAWQCGYARITITVKAAYHLAVTTAERAALEGLLTTCPAS